MRTLVFGGIGAKQFSHIFKMHTSTNIPFSPRNWICCCPAILQCNAKFSLLETLSKNIMDILMITPFYYIENNKHCSSWTKHTIWLFWSFCNSSLAELRPLSIQSKAHFWSECQVGLWCLNAQQKYLCLYESTWRLETQTVLSFFIFLVLLLTTLANYLCQRYSPQTETLIATFITYVVM